MLFKVVFFFLVYGSTSIFCDLAILYVLLTTEDRFLHLCEYLGGALLHFFEMTLLKFLQPHPVALEETKGRYTSICPFSVLFSFIFFKF